MKTTAYYKNKPVFYTTQQYYRACEEQRVIERNEHAKREAAARAARP